MEDLKSYLVKHLTKDMGNGILENVIIDSIIVTEEVNNNLDKSGLILEKRDFFTPVPGVKNYSYRIDSQLGTGGPGRQRHIHLFYNGKELLAMNVDASGHDGYHQVRLPLEVVPFLRDKGFSVPSNYIIEFYQHPKEKVLICEEMDCAAITKLALDLGEIVRKSNHIAIIESNIDICGVKCNSAISDKYQNLRQLENIPPHKIDEIKKMIVNFLNQNRKQNEQIEIFDDKRYTTPHSLFVAWNQDEYKCR